MFRARERHRDTRAAKGQVLTKDSTAYTKYAFFEWSLVLLDLAFDAVTALDFKAFEVVIRDVKGISQGYVPWLPK